MSAREGNAIKPETLTRMRAKVEAKIEKLEKDSEELRQRIEIWKEVLSDIDAATKPRRQRSR